MISQNNEDSVLASVNFKIFHQKKKKSLLSIVVNPDQGLKVNILPAHGTFTFYGASFVDAGPTKKVATNGGRRIFPRLPT